jgi:hypothetical protein
MPPTLFFADDNLFFREVYARSISVSGVVARQNMIYLMARKR